jgi:ABC-type multidrug transport system fused ATPase/permease subunit
MPGIDGFQWRSSVINRLSVLFQPQPKQAAAKKRTSRYNDLRHTVRLLSRFLGGERRLFTLALVMLIAEAGMAVFQSYPLAYLIDYLKGDRPDVLTFLGWPAVVSPVVDTMGLLTAGIILMAMINSLADSLAEIFLAKGGRSLGYNLRLALYSHLQRLSLAFHDKRRTGDILTRVTGDVAALEDFAIGSLSDIVGSLMVLVGTMAFLLYQSWEVALVAAVIVPVMSSVSNYFSQRIKAAAKKQRACEGDQASAAQEMLTSIRVIQTYSRAGFEQQRFAEHSQRAMVAALVAAGLQARFSWVVAVMEALAISGVIWLGLWLMDQSALTVGTLVLFIILIQNMFKPTRKIIKEWNTLGKVYASVERIGELLDRQPTVVDLPGAVEAPALRGQVEFRQVSFAYQPDPEEAAQDQQAPPLALNNISFDIAQGEVLALVGHTGAGKSTIAQLLPRLYDPSAGNILIDEHDIREYTLESLRSQISVVLQETILFSGSVAENIAYGRPEATPDEIIAAAIQANAHEFIEKLPEGYDTLLGERGANLSGGQRQRIAIARAFIRNAPILILDEPTTGLDAASSELVLLALRTLMKGKTTVIISHDLKLIRHADKIVVIREGEIDQMGTHRELLHAEGLYANLYFKQFGQLDLEPDAGEIVPGTAPAAEPEISSLPLSGARPANLSPSTIPVEPYQTRVAPASKLNGTHPPADSHPPTPVAAGDGVAGPRHVARQIDLLRNPTLQRELPGLATAFDAEAMREQLQTALFGKAHGNYTIESCAPGKATYLPGKSCLLRYELEVRDSTTGEILRPLVNARVFRSQSACMSYQRERLASLAALVKERAEIAPFTAPIAILKPLNLVVSVFPIDGDLPTLVGATDRRRMLELFQETPSAALDDGFMVEDCRVEVGHYGRQHRCVLRYDLGGRRPGSLETERRLVFGKVASDDRGGVASSAIDLLRERVLNGGSVQPFHIPQAFGFWPDLRLALLEAIPGQPQMSRLLKARLKNKPIEEPGLLSLEEALVAAAQMAAALHTSGISLGRRRTLADELDELRPQIVAVRRISPELGAQLRAWLKRLEVYARQPDSPKLCFSHGDFTHTQLVFEGTASGLVDFDTVCQAEPALDLGQFLAYQRLAAIREHGAGASAATAIVESLCAQFLNAYIEAAGDGPEEAARLQLRVPIYEVVSLMRMALHSWQKLKSSRLAYAVAILEERVSCLP